MQKTGLCLLLLFVIELCTGCWDRVEINDLAIVLAIGLDKTDDGLIQVSLLIPIPKLYSASGAGGGGGGGGSQKPPTMIISETGTGILDAFEKIQRKLSRKVFFSQVRVIVIGEKLAQDGVSGVLDFLSRYRESSLRAHILFTKEKVDQLLTVNPGIESVAAETIREEDKIGPGIKIFLKDFINMLTEEGINPVASQLTTVPLAATNNIIGDKNGHSQGTVTAIKGVAVFNKDKLIGWLDDKDAEGLSWLYNFAKDKAIIVDIPAEKGGGNVTIRIIQSNTQIAPSLNGDTIEATVKAAPTAVIFDNYSKLDLSDPQNVQFVERQVEGVIKTTIKTTLEKMQKQFKSDIFGFGAAVYRKYPQEWNNQYKDNWNEEFSHLTINVVCNVQIIRVGFFGKSVTEK